MAVIRMQRARAAIAGLALVMSSAACARPTPAVPSGLGAVPAGAAVSLAAWLESVAPTQRLEWRDLEAGCGGSRDCRRDLDRLADALRARCPRAADCGDPAARLLYVERTVAQHASGLYPDALPRAAEILATWRAALPTATPRTAAP
jgi:hypothetical protein